MSYTALLGVASGTPAELAALIKVLVMVSLVALAVIVLGSALKGRVEPRYWHRLSGQEFRC